MIKSIFVFVFFVPFTCLAQYTITGKTLGTTDKKPVMNASIFLNNTTIGTKSAENGTFMLNNVRPGQYDLVVSVLGYETFHEDITVNDNMSLADIGLSPKAILLREVNIKPNQDWEKEYEKFKQLFLGTSDNATRCKIINPDLLDMNYNTAKRIFTATSSDFLEIENKALGYKIKYLLTDLTNDYKNNMLYFEGSVLFEELKGSASRERRWKKNRMAAYEGSAMHFFRSAIAGRMQEEGFKVLRLIRTPNPDYRGGLDDKYIQKLVTTPLTVYDFVKKTDIKGQFALTFNDCLYVMYYKRHVNKHATAAPGAPDNLNDPVVTIITFEEQYAFFDTNGIVINPRSILLEGDWGKARVPDLLPVDYVPDVK